ncbi:glycosyltransferase [Lactococcus lactis]|uniref:glycosyltransferase n=1 Tax=Lactococcus lactis TaxID=1358 RepID=UPI002FE45A16
MIFVTVGTHEQPFNRLIKKIDDLVREEKITEEVYMQIGYSSYIPKHTQYSKVIGYKEMNKLMLKSDIIITHGGPSTYMQVIQLGKVPVVVPRQLKFEEHVNDHQLLVTKKVLEKGYPLIMCQDVENILIDMEKVKKMKSHSKITNNDEFVKKFILEVGRIFE